MRLHEPRCQTLGCPDHCLAPSVAAPVVVVASAVVLFVPLLQSLGLNLQSPISSEMNITFSTVLIGIFFLFSIFVGVIRKHEEIFLCIIDTLGIPGILFVVLYTLK
jgi:hypothetical protein